jgi:hypothetical protein
MDQVPHGTFGCLPIVFPVNSRCCLRLCNNAFLTNEFSPLLRTAIRLQLDQLGCGRYGSIVSNGDVIAGFEAYKGCAERSSDRAAIRQMVPRREVMSA